MVMLLLSNYPGENVFNMVHGVITTKERLGHPLAGPFCNIQIYLLSASSPLVYPKQQRFIVQKHAYTII
jgi:hypothetical protein